MMPSRYRIKRSRISGLSGAEVVFSLSFCSCSWAGAQAVRVQRAKTRCSRRKHSKVRRQVFLDAVAEIDSRTESAFTGFPTDEVQESRYAKMRNIELTVEIPYPFLKHLLGSQAV